MIFRRACRFESRVLRRSLKINKLQGGGKTYKKWGGVLIVPRTLKGVGEGLGLMVVGGLAEELHKHWDLLGTARSCWLAECQQADG